MPLRPTRFHGLQAVLAFQATIHLIAEPVPDGLPDSQLGWTLRRGGLFLLFIGAWPPVLKAILQAGRRILGIPAPGSLVIPHQEMVVRPDIIREIRPSL